MNTSKDSPWVTAPHVTFEHWLTESGLVSADVSHEVYCHIWAKWVSFCELHEKNVLTADARIVEKFLSRKARTKDTPLQPETARRYAALLSKVYGQLVVEDLLPVNPAYVLLRRMKALPKELPVALTHVQHQALIYALDQPLGRGWKGVRDRAMIALILGSGLKVSELISLLHESIKLDQDPPLIEVINTAGEVERFAPISPLARSHLEKWLKLRTELMNNVTLAFPANIADKKLSAATVFRQVKAMLERAGINTQHMGPQVLRNTFAVRQVVAGKPIEVVQEWLGHERKESTEVYLKLVQKGKGVGAV